MRAEIIETTAASFRTGLRWGVMGALLAVLVIFATASPGGSLGDPSAPLGEVLSRAAGL